MQLSVVPMSIFSRIAALPVYSLCWTSQACCCRISLQWVVEPPGVRCAANERMQATTLHASYNSACKLHMGDTSKPPVLHCTISCRQAAQCALQGMLEMHFLARCTCTVQPSPWCHTQLESLCSLSCVTGRGMLMEMVLLLVALQQR